MTVRLLIVFVALLTITFAGIAPPGSEPRAIASGSSHVRFSSLPPAAPSADASGFDPTYKLSLPTPVQDKNFYLLSLFQRNRGVRRLLSQSEVLKQIADQKIRALKQTANCSNVGCLDELMRFDPAAIQAVATELQSMVNQPGLRALALKDLRPSGAFGKYHEQPDAEMLVSAWKDAAKGMNRIIEVYGLGKSPRYPAIDRASFDVATETYLKLVKAKTGEIKLANDSLFFEPTLNFALKLLETNRRDEAARYEPLEAGENKAAIRNLKNIKWSDYPYSFLLVLGSGGLDLSTAISPVGAKRTDVAAQLFLQRKAPLLIVSGGYVHPMQTPFCEAIEMKRYLMEKYKIPETSILIDPYARHTTTNFRNAARLAFRYRLPAGLALVTSSESHITSSTADEFRTRCVNELGYFPMEFIKRISPVEAEFKPAVVSLFFDASDPLDP